MILIDPSYTKIALSKCKRSGKYNVYKRIDDNELLKLKRGFETLTNLCSCYHIDTLNVCSATSNEYDTDKSECFIHFAVNIPIKEYSTLTLGQHSGNYKFFDISEIDYNRKDVAWFVKDNIKTTKNYCRIKASIDLVKPICNNCVSFEKEKHFKRINIIIFDSSYKSFVLFKHDNVFSCLYENCEESLSENDQVNKILFNLLQNYSFVVDYNSVIVKQNIFSLYYCKTSNIDEIKNGTLVEINSINENGYFNENMEVSSFVMVNLERIKRYTILKSSNN